MVTGGETIEGLRMIWAGVQWAFSLNKAPWSAANVSVSIRPHIHPWYACNFRFSNEKPFVLELTQVKSISPKKLKIGRTDNEVSPMLLPGSEAQVLDLTWGVGAATDRPTEMSRTLFVNLENQSSKSLSVVFQLEGRLLDKGKGASPFWLGQTL